jgi:hypothetical protein
MLRLSACRFVRRLSQLTYSTYGCTMRYALQVTINNLDGTTMEEKADDLTQDELLDGIAHELQEHEGFASSFVITVVPKR